MKTLNLLKALVVLFLLAAPAQAQVTLEKVIGTAWTIGNLIQGETTLTPAYRLHTWVSKTSTLGYSPATDNITTRTVTTDLLGNPFYRTKVVWPGLHAGTEHSNAFPITSMAILDKTCITQVAPGHSVTNAVLQTQSEWVWLDHVEQTGLWPDDGPWTVWLKTQGDKTSCAGPRGLVGYYFRVPAKVALGGGYVSVTLGTANCTLNYPFYLAEDFYK